MSNRRITKEMAGLAAVAMQDAVYKKKTDAAKAAVDKAIEKYIRKKVPAPVLACAVEYKAYIKSSNTVKIDIYNHIDTDGHYSGGHKRVSGLVSFAVPLTPDSWYDYPMFNELKDCEDIKEVIELNKKYEDTVIESRRFMESIENALLSLKTEKKVTEQLPEALPYIKFPDNNANLPAPIFSDIRAMLQSVTNNKQ